MFKLNDVDNYILDHWADVVKFQSVLNSLNSNLEHFLRKEITNQLKTKDWWQEEFEEPKFRTEAGGLEIDIHKTKWKTGRGEWDIVYCGLWGVAPLDILLGGAEYEPPHAYIHAGLNRANRGKFEDLIKRDIAKTCVKFKITNLSTTKYPFRAMLRQTSTQWISIIKTNKYVDEILKQFDMLAKFIDPIDRALAKLNLKKK